MTTSRRKIPSLLTLLITSSISPSAESFSPQHHSSIPQSSSRTSFVSFPAPSPTCHRIECPALLPSSTTRSPNTAFSTPTTHIRLNSRLFLASISNNGTDEDDNDDDNHESKRDLPSDDELFRGTIEEAEETIRNMFQALEAEDDDEDDDDDEADDDHYAKTAPVEFSEDAEGDYIYSDEFDPSQPQSQQQPPGISSLARQSRQLNTTPLDWGSALTTLRSRVSDIESGKSSSPSNALFRTVSRERPNEAIGRFVREANPEVVAAMTGAVSSLLGGLSNPSMGVEMIVQANGEKLGNLCFQLMMTGYMFRNAEYVLALKSLMNIKGEGASLEEYRAAFNKLDKDGSGYLEVDEVEALLADVYDGKPPAFEVKTFLEFFDSNNDGRISWEEFEKGFGMVAQAAKAGVGRPKEKKSGLYLPGTGGVDDDDVSGLAEPTVSGTVKVELEDGKVIEVDAQDYVNDLKEQALELKRELAREKGLDPREMGIQDGANGGTSSILNQAGPSSPNGTGGIASYIASLQGDVKSLTQGISPDVVESMKMLIDFVLDGPGSGPESRMKGKQKEMELPGSALQQLALWQLVIGYRLRETEATGEWRKMLE